MDDSTLKSRIEEFKKLKQSFKSVKEDLLNKPPDTIRNENIAVCNIGLELVDEMLIAANKKDHTKLEELAKECQKLMEEVFLIFIQRLTDRK